MLDSVDDQNVLGFDVPDLGGLVGERNRRFELDLIDKSVEVVSSS